MLYIYILRSLKDGKIYIGKTKNLVQRFKQHNSGKVEATKGRLPLELIYYEGFTNNKDWNKEEIFLKSGIGKQSLKHRLEYTFKYSFGNKARL